MENMRYCYVLFFALLPLTIFSEEEKLKEVKTASTLVAVTQDRDKAVYDWSKRHQEVLELGKEGAADLVFIGDSIVHYWGGLPKAPYARGQASWDELFQGKKAVNLGFGWDRVENVLWRVQNGELLAHKPRVVVLAIGTNNLQENSAADIRLGIVNVCKEIRSLLPSCKVHVIGVLPRMLPTKLLATPAAVNSQLHQHLSGLEGVHFHDISHAFLDEQGALRGQFFSDGLHPNEKGYALFANEIRNVIGLSASE
jgi:lysophospholipase L1-like esterase